MFFDRYIIFGLKIDHVLDQILFYGLEIEQNWLISSVKMTIKGKLLPSWQKNEKK